LPRTKRTAYDWLSLSEEERGKIIAERAAGDAEQSEKLKRIVEEQIKEQQERRDKEKEEQQKKARICFCLN